MPNLRLYLCHPTAMLFPGLGSWIKEAHLAITSEAISFEIISRAFDDRGYLKAQDLASVVIELPGPVLLVPPFQQGILIELRRRLGTRSLVTAMDVVADSADLYAAMKRAIECHTRGEPMVAKKYAVALLLMRKLERELAWGGNDKGYEWGYNLPKGRGIPPDLANSVAEVANDLLCCDVLITKTSKGRTKYALNPARRGEISKMIVDREFANERLEAILLKDRRVVSARALDNLPLPEVD